MEWRERWNHSFPSSIWEKLIFHWNYWVYLLLSSHTHTHTRLYIYTYIYVCVSVCISYWHVGRVFPTGLGDWASVTGQVISNTQKWYAKYYKERIKGMCSYPGKWVVPFFTPWCGRYWKGSFWVTFEYGRPTYIYIHTYFSFKVGCDTRLLFKMSSTGLNSEFSSSSTSCHTDPEEHSLPYYLPITVERIIGFIYFPKVLALREMQTRNIESIF